MRVLAIAAHMDDETLGSGGTLARHALAGDEVHCCIVADRAYGHVYDPAATERERQACRAACAILGVHEVVFLGLHDERLDASEIDLVIPLEREIERLEPDVLYTHHRGDLNQDHRAVARASYIACRPHARVRPRRLLAYEVPSSTDQVPPLPEFAFQPSYYVDIVDTLDQKCEALAAYRKELREFPHPRSIRGVRVYAEKRGMEVGYSAAESFQVLRDSWPATTESAS